MSKRIACFLSLLCLPTLVFGKIIHKNHTPPRLNCSDAYQQKNYAAALVSCQQEADLSDPNAHTLLGLMAHRGLGLPRNDQSALEHFQFAAAKGDPIAQYHLAKFHVMDTLLPVDEVTAFQWLEKSAFQQYAPAAFLLALCYRNGIGTVQNLNQAEHWYEQAMSHGLSSAKDHALLQIQQAPEHADQDPHALFLLGKAHFDGQHLPQDDALALQYFEQAAYQKDPDAQAFLAWMLALGLGRAADVPQAIYWLNTALQNPEVPYQKSIAALHAPEYYALPRSAEKQYTMGRNLLESPFQEQDIQNGLTLLHLSAEQQHANAQFYLSTLYQHGKHVEKNLPLAFALVEKAAKAGHKDALYTLGWYHANGIGTERDIQQANTIFAQSVKKGDRRAKSSIQFIEPQVAREIAAREKAKRAQEAVAIIREKTADEEMAASTIEKPEKVALDDITKTPLAEKSLTAIQNLKTELNTAMQRQKDHLKHYKTDIENAKARRLARLAQKKLEKENKNQDKAIQKAVKQAEKNVIKSKRASKLAAIKAQKETSKKAQQEVNKTRNERDPVKLALQDEDFGLHLLENSLNEYSLIN